MSHDDALKHSHDLMHRSRQIEKDMSVGQTEELERMTQTIIMEKQGDIRRQRHTLVKEKTALIQTHQDNCHEQG